MNRQTQAKLTLVGAGPGDPDLVSVKGVKAIADADVILYDDLANKALLTYARSKTEKIYVGKRVGKHSHTQHAINELIVHFAREKGHVVRLKGGDPFIFGRGFEEIQFAKSFGIECSIVPGISSAHAVPALQGIPLTSRGISQSYWVVTATSKDGTITKDLALAAQSTATVVILMGTRKLQEICDTFSGFGKDQTPVAIIQNGTMENEKVVRGTVKTISEKARLASISSPAVIVVGETAGLSNEALLSELETNQLLN